MDFITSKNFCLKYNLNTYIFPHETVVFWLSSGEVLLWFFDLRAETAIFLNNKNHLNQYIKHWMALEITFCSKLDTCLINSTQNYKARQCLDVKHTELSHFDNKFLNHKKWQVALYTSHASKNSNKKQDLQYYTICSRYIFQAQTTFLVEFLGLWCKCRGNFHILKLI